MDSVTRTKTAVNAEVTSLEEKEVLSAAKDDVVMLGRNDFLKFVKHLKIK